MFVGIEMQEFIIAESDQLSRDKLLQAVLNDVIYKLLTISVLFRVFDQLKMKLNYLDYIFEYDYYMWEFIFLTKKLSFLISNMHSYDSFNKI